MFYILRFKLPILISLKSSTNAFVKALNSVQSATLISDAMEMKGRLDLCGELSKLAKRVEESLVERIV